MVVPGVPGHASSSVMAMVYAVVLFLVVGVVIMCLKCDKTNHSTHQDTTEAFIHPMCIGDNVTYHTIQSLALTSMI